MNSSIFRFVRYWARDSMLLLCESDTIEYGREFSTGSLALNAHSVDSFAVASNGRGESSVAAVCFWIRDIKPFCVINIIDAVQRL